MPDDPALAAVTVTAVDFAPDTTGFAGSTGGAWTRAELPLFADDSETGTLASWSATMP